MLLHLGSNINASFTHRNVQKPVIILVVRASDQNIIDRQSLLMQILLVACLNIVLFRSKDTVTNIMSQFNDLD